MTFTQTVPTKPGDYAWKKSDEHLGHSLVQVSKVCGPDGCGLMVVFPGYSRQTPQSAGGVWCRLVHVEELRLAYREGFQDGRGDSDWDESYYAASRAKRIAEGIE